MNLENISCQKSFGGWHKRYRHRSRTLNCDMTFAVYLPPQIELGEKLPVLYWLSGRPGWRLGFRPRRRLLFERHANALGAALPDARLRGA